ncbi:aldehyde dehydrogenase family protein [Clostridium fermenticellae]|uniref:Aldehyde dehydrogenase family protein n=1 Tax=Clostridium fermenticellae TaxID=2068654 RepID=A0A386H3X3_9CLOT|nr:aldehyde dehydrogenase family protein [Clostridium fermenticellae]AYD40417.1 aldehyde dehydrogenase family protein [Clostridium fermenticellae]
MNIIDNDLLSMQEARILVENAREAQKKLATFSQEKLDEIVERMVEEIEKHLKELAIMSNDETDYGKWKDKYVKNHFICKYLRNRLKGMRCVGIINRDVVGKTLDVGVPMGVIIGFCPATSPVSTTIYKALIAIKSGNAIIFSPHKRAQNTICKTVDILTRAAEGVGLPDGALACLHTVSESGSLELMNHKYTSLIMNTGVPDMLDAAYKSGKPVIYGGNGNGPVFIERTADIDQAVKDIIDSKSFDYGIVSSAEQSIVVDSCIASQVEETLQKNGAYFMTDEESRKLASVCLEKDGRENLEAVGKSPQFLARNAGFTVSDDVKILVSKQKYVSLDNPYSKEKLCPVLAFYIEEDWMHACEKCIELLLTERQGHTLVIHSKDEEVIRQFALKKPVGRVLVNTPGTFGSMGATTNLFPSMTLGSGSAGKGMTSDNVSPMNLIYVRKVGYGVRKVDELIDTLINEGCKECKLDSEETDDNIKLLEDILTRVINNFK